MSDAARKQVRINHPGDGDWVMQRAGGRFVAGFDHSLASYDTVTDAILGGFVVNTYLGNTVFVHNAGDAPAWCSRTLLWMLFSYCFRQLGVGKVLAPVAQNNPHSLNLCLRAGFRLETRIGDAIAPGVDLLLLAMHAEHCRWLRFRSTKYYCSGLLREVA